MRRLVNVLTRRSRPRWGSREVWFVQEVLRRVAELRIGRVLVAIHRLSVGIDQLRRDLAGQELAGKVQLVRD